MWEFSHGYNFLTPLGYIFRDCIYSVLQPKNECEVFNKGKIVYFLIRKRLHVGTDGIHEYEKNHFKNQTLPKKRWL